MLNFVNELSQRYAHYIMKTFGKFWNEFNKYGVPKNTFKCM